MAKRKLSKNQTRRMRQQQTASIKRAQSERLTVDEDNLGHEQEGLVIAHFGTQAEVEIVTGDSPDSVVNKPTKRCHMRANLPAIVAGDKVIWRDGPDLGVIVSLQARSSILERPDPYGNLKPVAANVDQMVITIAPKPEPFVNLIDRYLVAAAVHQIQPLLVINKSDMLEGSARDDMIKLAFLYEQLGYPVLKVSAHHGTELQELEQALESKTSIFVGQSGVGKSSLVQTMIPELNIKVGKLSEGTDKGRHTTTHSQLFHFPNGGSFIDSPGIREFGLWHVDEDDVLLGFPEIAEAANHCKFRNCSHNKEPGCAVKTALKEKRISSMRYQSYQQILASLTEVEMKNKH